MVDFKKRLGTKQIQKPDRKSTRLNCSHLVISYAVFCLKKRGHAVGTRRTPIAIALARLEGDLPRPDDRGAAARSAPQRTLNTWLVACTKRCRGYTFRD